MLVGSAVAVALPISLFAPYLLVAFGRTFVNGAPTIIALSVSAVFEVAVLALYQQVFTSGWMWWGLFIALLRSTLLTAFAAGLAPVLGAQGVACLNAIAQAGTLALTYAIVRVKMASLFMPVLPEP